jgi:hypothetical protein
MEVYGGEGSISLSRRSDLDVARVLRRTALVVKPRKECRSRDSFKVALTQGRKA